MSKKYDVPYKMYLEEKEIPKKWYNVRADMKTKQAPLLNPGTLEPMGAADLAPVFCEELVAQELDDNTPYYDIPKEIHDFYKIYRPSPLMHAEYLEKAASQPRPVPASGALPSPWPAPSLISTAKSTWSRFPMSRSRSAAK